MVELPEHPEMSHVEQVWSIGPTAPFPCVHVQHRGRYNRSPAYLPKGDTPDRWLPDLAIPVINLNKRSRLVLPSTLLFFFACSFASGLSHEFPQANVLPMVDQLVLKWSPSYGELSGPKFSPQLKRSIITNVDV